MRCARDWSATRRPSRQFCKQLRFCADRWILDPRRICGIFSRVDTLHQLRRPRRRTHLPWIGGPQDSSDFLQASRGRHD